MKNTWCILSLLILLFPASGTCLAEAIPPSLLPPSLSAIGNHQILREGKATESSARRKYSLHPNTSLAEHGDLKAICFSPVDSVIHYVGATIDSAEGETPATSSELQTAGEPFDTDEKWELRFGAGVERRLNKRASFDLEYRYSSPSLDLDLDAFRQKLEFDHHFSAGVKICF